MTRIVGWGMAVVGLAALPFAAEPALARAPQDSARALAIPAELRDLPLVVAPAAGAGTTLAIMISGDGGWAAIDRGIAEALTGAGIPVVGLNSLRYFWSRRTPEQSARDLERIVRYYVAATGRREVVLVGYSLGADVLPFMATRLPADLRRQVTLVALLGVSPTVDFKFHVSEWWSASRRSTDLPVLPEASNLARDTRVLCVYGAEENDSICPALPPGRTELVKLEGAHHFDGGYAALGRLIVRAAQTPRAVE